jgi:hypothetical protein
VGYFGTYVYDGTTWSDHDADDLPTVSEPWLMVDIHDSDITTVRYAPAGPGTGVAYLGETPRSYFEDDAASPPTDVAREAAGLAGWWATRRMGDPAAKQAELAGYLAADTDLSAALDDVEDFDDLDEAEIFVEVKTIQFLTALDLPLPKDLAAL